MKPPVAYFGGKSRLAPWIASLLPPHRVTYVDPPYLESTRTSWNDANGWSPRPAGDYAHEFQHDEQHRGLAEVLANARATVLVSGYPSELYEKLYAGWWRAERRVLCRVSNGRTGQNFHRTEVLWSNRPIDEGRLSFAAEGVRPIDTVEVKAGVL